MTILNTSPTSRWLAALPELPPLSGPAATAERLLLLVHYGIDWSTWIGRYRTTYWSDILPARVYKATYRSNNLQRWWTTLAGDLTSAPRSSDERTETAKLLQTEPAPVLAILRDETDALLLRTRLVADAVRSTRPAKDSSR